MLKKLERYLLLFVFVFTTMVCVDMDVVKAEETESYTITFKSSEGYIQGDAEKTELSFQLNKGLTLLGNTSFTSTGGRKGYRLVGWKIENGDDKIYNVQNGENIENIMMYYPSEDTTFVAVWEEVYTITYKTDKGYIDDGDEQEYKVIIAQGKSLDSDWVPYAKCEGYKFNGWMLEGDETETVIDPESYVPDKNAILVPKWVEVHTITFYTEEGTLMDNDDMDENKYEFYVKKGEPITFTFSAKRQGYIFTGWKINNEGILYSANKDDDNCVCDYVPKGDVTFVAQWEKGYMVTFHSDEGFYDNDIEYNEMNMTVKQGDKIDWSAVGNRTGYVITGWKLNGEGIIYGAERDDDNSIYDYVPTGDVTFVAQWEKAFIVTFHSDEGFYDGDECKDIYRTVKKGNKVDNSYWGDREGYVLTGWKINDAGSLYGVEETDENSVYDYIPTEDVTFVAQWEEAWNITLHSDDGYMEFASPYSTDYTYRVAKGKSIYSVDIYRPGYVITGWKIEGQGEKVYSCDDGEDSIYNYIPNGDTTLIAVWTSAWIVTFHSDEGYLGYWDPENIDYNISVEKGKTISSVPGTRRPGYECVGWKVKGIDSPLYGYNDDEDNYIFGYMPEGNVTFVAVWKKTGEDDNKSDDSKETDDNKKPVEEPKVDDKKADDKKVDDGNNNPPASATEDKTQQVKKEYSVGETTVENGNKFIVESDNTVAFDGDENSDTSNIVIPDKILLNGKEYKVTEIKANAFSKNTKIKKVTIGSNVETIGKNAFAGCSNLTTVTVKGNNLTKVEEGAFKNCKKLTKAVLNKKITTIGKNAFAGDGKLKTITIKSTKIKRIGKNAFKNINKKATIYVPKSLTKKQLTKYKNMIKKAGVPKSVKIKKK